jgi:hypothetical protein
MKNQPIMKQLTMKQLTMEGVLVFPAKLGATSHRLNFVLI